MAKAAVLKLAEGDAGDSQHPVGEAGENALNACDGQPPVCGRLDGPLVGGVHLLGLLGAKRQQRAKRLQGEGAVAEEKEEQEQHDNALRDEAERVAGQAGELASEIGGGGLGGVADIDGVGEGLRARGEQRMSR